MNSLEDPAYLYKGAIVGNPIQIPNGEILRAMITPNGWLKKPSIDFQEVDFKLFKSQSALGTWSAYNFFDELQSNLYASIGVVVQDALLRIIPSGDLGSEEDTREFIFGENTIRDALDYEILKEVSYENAVMEIVNILAEGSSEESLDFEDAITGPIDRFRQEIYDLGISDQKVFQVTPYGQGRIIVLPRNFFDDGGKDDKEIDFHKLLESLLGKLHGGGPNPVPA